MGTLLCGQSGVFRRRRLRGRFHGCIGWMVLAGMSVLAGGMIAREPAPRLAVGKVPPVVALKGEEGGRLDGQPWKSTEIKDQGKVAVLFYVDPDEKDLNESVADAIKRRKFPDALFQSIAVINMAATWKPNWLIAAILKRKQKKFPRTVYVRDNRKVLVHRWGLADNSYVICVFDADGRLLFEKAGKFSGKDGKALLKTLRAAVERLRTKRTPTR